MTKPQQQAHTPGQLEFSKLGFVMNDGATPLMAPDPEQGADCHKRVALVDCQTHFKRGTGHQAKCPERDANSRLFRAAWNSYDKHCGPRAVECAEADLLGEALAALHTIREVVKGPLPWEAKKINQYRAEIEARCRALLAKAGQS